MDQVQLVRVVVHPEDEAGDIRDGFFDVEGPRHPNGVRVREGLRLDVFEPPVARTLGNNGAAKGPGAEADPDRA